jgi:hypothetical protein
MEFNVPGALQKYFLLYKELEERGGPEEDADFFEEILNLQEEILAHFGLPPADRYRQIFWKLTEPEKLTGKLLEKTESKLRKAAEKYLSKPAQTDLEILTKAKKKKLDPFDVLPELGQPTHDYTFFLYRVLLMNNQASPEEVLAELNRIKELNCYREIAELKFSDIEDYKQSPLYQQYSPNLKYLKSYLEYQDDEEDLE